MAGLMEYTLRHLTTYNRLWPLAVLFLLLALWPGCDCVDTPGTGQNEVDPDASTDDVLGGDDDTDPGPGPSDPDTGPTDPCLEVNCGEGQTCYHGNCFSTCTSDLDCADGEHCFQGRCAPTDCQGVDCPDNMACYRGACYDECSPGGDCPGGSGITCVDGACVTLDDQCDNLECEQITCPPDGDRTTLTGTVHIPSGEYPLPNASVYVPNSALEPIPQGASCERCEDMLTGDPLVQAITDVDGHFELINVPVTDNLPVVIQSGKWRRELTVDTIEPCTENQITDPDRTRLPRNQSEGNIPDIAVTSGQCDALECLIYNIGLDDEEFTNPGGGGKVNIYQAHGGVSSYDSNFNNGASIPSAFSWWEDVNNLVEYDIILHSCECSQRTGTKPPHAHQALADFTHQGGRVFTSHWENIWLQENSAFDVADWAGGGQGSTIAQVNTSFGGGQTMYEWMLNAGALDANGHFSVSAPRYTIGNLNQSLSELWLTYTNGTPLYFAFNTPITAPEEEHCGRVVFSDLHVSGSIGSFPSGCGTSLSPQEKALLYMIFDLSACIAPECDPITCDDVDNNCGIHDDGCGGTIDCGICCVAIDEPCEVDEDCCSPLWCDQNTGLCTDRCRDIGESCNQNSDCCSDLCGSGSDGENQCVVG